MFLEVSSFEYTNHIVTVMLVSFTNNFNGSVLKNDTLILRVMPFIIIRLKAQILNYFTCCN